MKQVVQSLRTSELCVQEVPAPSLRSGMVLVATAASLVSAGTERMLVDFAEKNLLQKARARPDLLRQTIDKAKREGVLTTIDAVRNRLDQPLPLGYSCAGIVLEAAADVPEFKPGDRVACAGAGFANHAAVVAVPRNLVVKIPDGVPFEAASFTTLGAIALQGIRLAEVKIGEIVGVIGLGLLGQLAVQMLKASGCTVVGMDIQPARVTMARNFGADYGATTGEELIALCQDASGGRGADALLITADTKSNEPIETAGEATRERGIVVAVGAVGLNIPRKAYYEKEIDLRISRSYGPGRYDADYEEAGHDYPYAYVRWTEGRNMQAFANLLRREVQVGPLITHRFAIEEAERAYDVITGKAGEPFMGVVLTYPEDPDLRRIVPIAPPAGEAARPTAAPTRTEGHIGIGVLGAGLFAGATLLPAIKEIPAIERIGIASGAGLTARTAADRFGFAFCATDLQEIWGHPRINTVAILTRHNLHARQVMEAWDAGKNVFVEKPLCLTNAELEAIIARRQKAVEESGAAPAVMVGYNRRFAPFIAEVKTALQDIKEPLLLQYRSNAGYIPPDHWTQDPVQGGGRLRGEGCHFIDLLFFLAGSAPQRVSTRALPDGSRYAQDNFMVEIEFANGTLGSVLYAANGDKNMGKESLEVFGGGLSARMDDFRTLHIRHGSREVKRAARLRQDKGHKAEWEAFAAHLLGQAPAPIAFEDIVHSTRATLAAYQSLIENRTVEIAELAGTAAS